MGKFWTVTFWWAKKQKYLRYEVEANDLADLKARMAEIAEVKGIELQHYDPYSEHPKSIAGIGAIFRAEKVKPIP